VIRSWTPNESWDNDGLEHGPFRGDQGIFFAEVTGDGRADPILVDDNTVTARRKRGRHSAGAPRGDRHLALTSRPPDIRAGKARRSLSQCARGDGRDAGRHEASGSAG